jgi:colanic acid biosynthesis glycosyl transferase WcaI
MKVIIWGINYRPESTGIAPYNAELAEYLSRAEHDVSVVTGFPYYPQWKKAATDKQLYRREEINGVRVFRCAQYVPKTVTTAKRILHELTFGLSSLLRVLFLPRPDIYIVVSPPLFLGFCAWIATVVKRSQYVFHVQDLQPGAAVGLGMVKGKGFIRMLYALERFAYRHAAAVSGISDGMMDEFRRKGVKARKRIYFPNWLRTSTWTAPVSGAFRRKFGFSSTELLAVYSGNLGRKQGIDVLLETAQLLKGAPVALVIAGAGAEREALALRVADLNLRQHAGGCGHRFDHSSEWHRPVFLPEQIAVSPAGRSPRRDRGGHRQRTRARSRGWRLWRQCRTRSGTRTRRSARAPEWRRGVASAA